MVGGARGGRWTNRSGIRSAFCCNFEGFPLISSLKPGVAQQCSGRKVALFVSFKRPLPAN
ncbi:hypothetical protein RHECNPAF_35000114 [Rhizobium etli CNPAF512]|nr:hypothetical protein RHECNPAF_35000114 [Rhizobium etli CNPAF512]